MSGREVESGRWDSSAQSRRPTLNGDPRLPAACTFEGNTIAANEEKTKAELIAELAELQQRAMALEEPGIALQLFRDLMDNPDDILAIVEPGSGRLLDANERISELLGYRRAELLTMAVTDFDRTMTDKAAWEQFIAELRPRGSMDLKTVLARNDGAEVPIEVQVRYTTVRQKEFIVVVSRDISSRDIAQKELRSEREFIEAVLDASPDTFFVFDVVSGTPVRWNRVFREVSGYSDVEIAGMKAPDDFYAAGDIEIAHDALRSLADAGYVRLDLPLLTKDGKKIPYEYIVTMIEMSDPATSLACSVGRDVTERRRSEEALRQSEEQHRGFLDSLSAGVVAHAPDTSILYWNRMSLQILGLSEDQMLGRSAYDPRWSFLDEDGSVMAADDYPVNLTLRKQADLSGYVVGVVRPVSNDVIWAFCNSHRVLADNGELEHILVSFLDITALKKAGEERRSLQAQVQHAQKLESLGVLAGGIAHDFNNLLMTILGNTDLALQDLSPVSPVRSNIQEVEGAARRAADLAKQMLAYSGRGRFVIAALDLSEIVDEMAHLLESSISKKVRLKTRLNPRLPAIDADAAQIQQVVMNLITNASEAIPEDEPGTIIVSTGAQECRRDYLARSYLDEKQPPGEYVYLEVSDTGCGMDEGVRAALFDPFFTTKFTGRGLGLAAVLGIVRGHDGAIMVDSKPGKGTTFRVLFPAAANKTEEPAPTGDLTKRNGWQGTGTVLVVDDDDSVRRLAIRMVERMGFEALSAADGQEAVEVFREHADRIICVLLDLTMPRMDGGEACLEIQRIRPDVAIVLSSGYEEAEVSERFDGYGMAGFIHKPYTMGRLREVLQGVLGVEP